MKIKSEIREVGKKATKELRENGKLPAILYGRKFDSMPISFDYKEFYHLYRESIGQQNFFFIKVKSKEYRTLIKEVQIDPVSRRIVHIDFQEIYAGQKIDVEIPIKIIGDAPGVLEGGIIDMNLREIQIKCLPKDLPESLEIDVSKLEIGDSIHIEELSGKFSNIEILEEMGETVVSIILPKVEEEKVEEELEEVGEEAAEEGEEKAEETEKEDEKEEKQK